MGWKEDMQEIWDSVWLDADLMTVASDKDLGVRRKTSLGVKDGRIVWLGDADQIPAVQIQHEYDCRDLWLTPGFIDCHTHFIYAGHRAQEFVQRITGASYEMAARHGGGIQSTVDATRAASEATLFEISQVRLQRLLQEGVTTLEVKSGYGLDLVNERKMLNCARQLTASHEVNLYKTFLGAHAVPREWADDADAYIDHVCDKMLPSLVAEGLVDAVDGFCERIAFDSTQIARVFSAAKALGVALKLHADQLSDAAGAQLAADFGALSADHIEYSSEAGIAALAQAGTTAVLLPGAFYCLQETQKPPLEWLRKYQVPFALASDCNPGSSPLFSILLVMNLACTLWQVSVQEAIMGVTCHAARALGLAKTHGRLALGLRADFAIWAISDPNELIYQIGQNPCVARVLAGQVTSDSRLFRAYN